MFATASVWIGKVMKNNVAANATNKFPLSQSTSVLKSSQPVSINNKIFTQCAVDGLFGDIPHSIAKTVFATGRYNSSATKI